MRSVVVIKQPQNHFEVAWQSKTHACVAFQLRANRRAMHTWFFDCQANWKFMYAWFFDCQATSKPLYRGFPSFCDARCHALYKHMRAHLFSNRFSVMKLTHRTIGIPTHTTRQPQNIVQKVGVVRRTAHTCTMLTHDAFHCKKLENRDTRIFQSVVLLKLRMCLKLQAFYLEKSTHVSVE